MLLLFAACSGGRKEVGAAITERDSMAVLDTKDVTTLISDSGVTRYRIRTAEWQVFDRKRPSYWAFEKGIYLEKFDSLFNVEASIKADTAYYYDKKKLWKLMGHVHVQNIQNEKFDTSLLYWDQNKHLVYTDRFIRMEQPDKIVEGYGFDADEQMIRHNIHNISGVFYVDADNTGAPAAASDSVRSEPTKNRGAK
jgi:LPS export ABC transporter protein LptC